MGVLEWPKTSPAEAKDAILQAKSLQQRGSKIGTKKVMKNVDEGTKKDPKWDSQIIKKRSQKWTLT